MVPAIEDGWGMPEVGLRNDPSSAQRRLSSRSDGGVLRGAVGASERSKTMRFSEVLGA